MGNLRHRHLDMKEKAGTMTDVRVEVEVDEDEEDANGEEGGNLEDDEEQLVQEFGVPGAFAEEILGYDEEVDDLDLEVDEDYETFQTRVRVAATKRAEANRRPGGLKTQQAMQKMVQVWYRL